MNDFTKDELEYLKDYLIEGDSFFTRSKYVNDLIDKLQYMIDNYCEHEPLKKQITKAIDSCKNYETKESEMLIFAYRNVLRWMAKQKV